GARQAQLGREFAERRRSVPATEPRRHRLDRSQRRTVGRGTIVAGRASPDSLASGSREQARNTRKDHRVGMQKVAFNQLREPVQAFLARARVGQGIVVEDEAGRARYGVVEYVAASPAEQEEASQRLQQLQQKTKRAIEEQGGTVDEVERLILTDDD